MSASHTPLENHDNTLKGKLLVAMPTMADPRFAKGVLFMLEHNAEGAMGILINKPLEAVKLRDLLEQLSIPATADNLDDVAVHFGGPVDIGRGFVVHSPDFMLAHSSHMGPVAVTTSLDMLGRIGAGTGPRDLLFCLGYAGWTPGQLEDEIKQNAWLHVPIHADLLFSIAHDKRWAAAMALAGIDPDHLSTAAGHA
jgi:putative transcriptional regulator